MTSTEEAERDAWLTWRRQGVGASDVAGIIGVSPWSSPWSVWADKVALTGDIEPTDAMLSGTFAETIIAQFCEERAGLTVRSMQERCEHPVRSWMRATLDGRTGFGDDQVLVEMKWSADTHAEWQEEIPVHYRCQAAWQSAVTGVPVVVFAVLHVAFGRPQFETYRYEPDPDDITWLVERCERFWTDNVIAGIPPEADGSSATADAIAEAFRPPICLDPIEADDALLLDLSKLAVAKTLLKEQEAAKKAAENRIKAAIGKHDGATHEGKPLVTWKPQQKRSVSATALTDAHPDIAAELVTTSTFRVLRPTTRKKD